MSRLYPVPGTGKHRTASLGRGRATRRAGRGFSPLCGGPWTGPASGSLTDVFTK